MGGDLKRVVERGGADNTFVQFLDKVRQKAREKKLGEKAKEILQKQSEVKEGKPDRQRPAQAEVKRAPAAKRRLLEGRQDESDFAEEYTLLKKLKKGKLTEVTHT